MASFAAEIELVDPIEDVGAKLVKEVAPQDQRRAWRRNHDRDRFRRRLRFAKLESCRSRCQLLAVASVWTKLLPAPYKSAN